MLKFKLQLDYRQIDITKELPDDDYVSIGYITDGPNGNNLFIPDSECPGLTPDELYEIYQQTEETVFGE